MAEQWVSIAEAAATMKIHPRTVERRAAAGKMQARRNDDGQVQVYIDLPDPEPSPSESIQADAFETVREMADRQVDIAAGSASALVRAAQEQSMRAEHQLDLARQDAGRYRRETQMALSLVAVMLLLVILAVGWGAHVITSDRDRAVTAEERATVASQDLSQSRLQLQAASTARDKAEGELTAYKTTLAGEVERGRPHPTTRPDTLLGRLMQTVTGDSISPDPAGPVTAVRP